ncbi:MAG: hypothetical protein JNM17_09855 [Archangium sp.]|nr:hypothetical protein [Archangium sp.]
MMTRLVPVLAMVLSIGCTTTGSNTTDKAKKPVVTADAYYPLNVGTAWNYEVKLLGETRTIDVTTLRKNAEGYVEDSTGAQFIADAYGVRDQKRYLLRNPIETGNKWTNVVSVSSVENYEIVASGQACEAPAGKWDDCVVVESRNRVEEGTVLVNEMTFAPGIGIVRLTTVLESNGKQIPQSSLALLKFTPAK